MEPTAPAPGAPDAARSSAEPVRRRPPEERERLVEALADRFDVPISVLGVVFLLLVLAETIIRPTGALGTAFLIASWTIWALFVAEFVLRAVVAPSLGRFFRRNWWQIVFLAVPFLRFLRAIPALRALRTARAGRVLSSAVRTSRSAGRRLGDRVTWLAATTVIVVLASSQLVYELGGFETYGDALHRSALATVAGHPMDQDAAFAQLLDVVLGVYSVVVFATLAGSIGAFILERQRQDAATAATAGVAGSPDPAT